MHGYCSLAWELPAQARSPHLTEIISNTSSHPTRFAHCPEFFVGGVLANPSVTWNLFNARELSFYHVQGCKPTMESWIRAFQRNQALRTGGLSVFWAKDTHINYLKIMRTLLPLGSTIATPEKLASFSEFLPHSYYD